LHNSVAKCGWVDLVALQSALTQHLIPPESGAKGQFAGLLALLATSRAPGLPVVRSWKRKIVYRPFIPGCALTLPSWRARWLRTVPPRYRPPATPERLHPDSEFIKMVGGTKVTWGLAREIAAKGNGSLTVAEVVEYMREQSEYSAYSNAVKKPNG
jgi:hypothetical protein